MAINAAYLEYRLSGGAGNTDPNAALGGVKSSELIASQSSTAPVNVTGVSVLFAAGNAEGIGTLAFDFGDQTLQWTPFGGTAGPPIAVTANGRYALFGGSDVGMLAVNVTTASLPGSDQTDSLTIANVLNELFDNVSRTDSFNGDTEYRCFYIHNAHATENFIAIIAYIGANPSPGTVAMGPDPAGAGDGVATGVATTIANENTAPAGVTFNTGLTEGTGVNLGTLNAGQSRAIWMKRIIPGLNTIANPESLGLLTFQLYF